MRFILFAFTAAIAALAPFASSATDVMDVDTIKVLGPMGNDIQHIPAGITNVNVKGYAAANDGGGGQFVVGPATCEDSDDGVAIKQVNLGRCWYRQFTGPIDVAWYGVKDASDPANGCLTQDSIAGCNAAAVMNDIFDMAKIYGDGGVTTGGRSVVINTADLTIGNHQYLTCGGAPGGGVAVDAYQNLKSSIILNPAFKIDERANTRFEHCVVRPTWLVDSATSPPTTPTIPPTSIRDVINIMHNFTGTGIVCASSPCTIQDIMVLGFDVCLETDTASHVLIDDVRAECNVGVWNHQAGGGNKMSNVTVNNLVESNTKFDDKRIDQKSWPLVKVLNASGSIVARLSLASGDHQNDIQVNDTVLVSDLGPPGIPVTTTGITDHPRIIENIPASTGDHDGAGDIRIGDTVTDISLDPKCTSGVVSDIDVDLDTGTGTVRLLSGWSCSSYGSTETFLFSRSSYSPPGGNGHWRVSSVSNFSSNCDQGYACYDIGLQGSSWAGPAMLNPTWNANTQVVSVLDTTNVTVGQYLCTTATASSVPFCTPPTGFAFSTTSLQAAITSAYTGSVNVGSVANWPLTGLVKVDSEYMSYRLEDATHIDVLMRGMEGTTAASHAISATVQAAAPTVLFVNAAGGAVIVSTPAQSTCAMTCTGITFANDTFLATPDYVGQIVLNPGYHMYTANAEGGGNPSASVIAKGNGSADTVTVPGMGFKVQPGMMATDISSTPAWDGDLTVDLVTGDAVKLQGLALPVAFANHNIQFTGCGYPGFPGTGSVGMVTPWLGNCAATSILVGGDGSQSQGFVCEYVHTFGNEVQFHTIDAPAMSCTNPVIPGGGGAGDQLDPDAVAIWIDGKATKTQFTNGRVAGARISILDTPRRFQKGRGHVTGQVDGVSFSNMTLPGSIILGADSKVTFTGMHGKASEDVMPIFVPGTVFEDGTSSSVEDVVASGMDLHDWTVFVNDTAAYPRLYCSGNNLATALCGQVRGTPTCSAAGCLGVTGSDTDFDVTLNGTVTTASIVLAAGYPAAPVCRVSLSATSGGAATPVAITSVDRQSYGTTVAFKTTNAVTHIYGGCKPPA